MIDGLVQPEMSPGLTDALSHLRPGDILVVWRLDWLGRSLRHLIDVIADLESRVIGFNRLRKKPETNATYAIF